jgi:hypothetical protein
VKTGTAETTTETSAAATERKPHVCRAFACPECGKTDTAFGEQAGKLMDELQEARKAACGHGAAWHEQAEWLLALAAGKGWAWDGRQFAKPGPAGQAAVAGKHAGHRVTANQKNTRARCETCREWFDTAAAS